MKRLTITTVVAAMMLLSAKAQEVIDIQYNDNTAKVTVPSGISDVTSKVSGANVTITSATTSNEYTYRVKGKSNDGSLTIKGEYKFTLQLAGVELTNQHDGAAINIDCGKRIAVELAEGTVNRLTDAPGGTHKGAIHFKGHPEFEGGGTLFVTGKTKHAIDAKEYVELKASTGTINILGAVSDGIHCGKGNPNNEHNYFLMRGGIVNIQDVGSDGIDSDDYGVIRIDGGCISANVAAGGTGLKADSLILMTAGKVSIAVTGDDSEGLSARYATTISGGKIDILVSGNGSKGIKGKQVTETTATVRNGGFVTVNGGEINLQITGGNLTKGTDKVDKCMGLSVDANFEQTGGTITLTALGPEAHTYNVKGKENRTGGTFEEVKAPWSMDTFSYQYDMSAFIAVTKESQPLTDYSSLAVGAFIEGKCVGYAVFQNNQYGVMRIHSNNASDSNTITFKVYDYVMEKEYDLTPEKAVTFANTSCVGSPSDPLMLDYSPGQDLVGIDPVKGTRSSSPRKVLVGRSIRIFTDQHEYDTNGRQQR